MSTLADIPDQTFHQSISKVLFISQIFALLPVSNVLKGNVEALCYSRLSLQSIYATVIVAWHVLEFGAVINLVLKEGLNFHTSGTLSLFVVCVLEHVYFWRLATKWPFIMATWRQAEECFLRAPYRLYATFNMKRRMYVLAFVVVTSAFVEHILLVSNSFHTIQLEQSQCKLNISLWESLYRRERFHLYVLLPLSVWWLPFLEWVNLTLAYPRSYTDVFIMCVAIGLTARFRQLYLRIEAVHMKAMPALFWTEVRQHYVMLKHLVRLINNEIAPLVLLACSNNMYFICFQLFNSFQNIGVDLVVMVAFWYSLLFAIVRTMLTLYIAAAVNDYTKKILLVLRDVPSRSWCVEIERFSEQLCVDLTALSGSGLFFLTRKLILAMASTIVTYELLVTDIINKGAIQQKTTFCSEYWMDESTSAPGNPEEYV